MKVKKNPAAMQPSAIAETNYDFMKGLYDLGVKIKNKEATWEDAENYARAYGKDMSADYIRQGFRIIFMMIDAGFTFSKVEEAAIDELTAPVSRTVNEDGSQKLEKLVALFEGEPMTPEVMLKAFNLSPEDWKIKSSSSQQWHSAVKGGKKIILYSIKIFVEPRSSSEITFADIDAYFARANKKPLPAVKKFEVARNEQGKTYLEIDLADVHVGLLAWKPETGEHYDLDIAKNLVLHLMQDIVDRNKNNHIDEIVLVTLGDIIHVDNGKMETTHGTRQDVEGRIPKMIDTASDTLVNAIRILEQLKAPIRYVYVPGNHDTNTGYMLAKLVEALLMNDDNVTFDTRPALFKCLDYGATVVGIAHGEANDKRAPLDMLTTHRRQYGKADAAEIHLGHLHCERVKEIDGIMVHRVPAVCESSYWEKSMGYAAIGRGIQTFTYEETTPGYIGIGRHYIASYKNLNSCKK